MVSLQCSDRHFSLRQFAQYLQNTLLVFTKKRVIITLTGYTSYHSGLLLKYAILYRSPGIFQSQRTLAGNIICICSNSRVLSSLFHFLSLPFSFTFHSLSLVQELFTTAPRFVTDDISLGDSLTKVRLRNFSGTLEISNSMFEEINCCWRDQIAMRQIAGVSMFSSPIINENIQKINITLILSCECSDNNWKFYLCIYKSWNLTFRFIFKIKENEDILFFLCVIFIRSLRLLYKIFLIDIIHNS